MAPVTSSDPINSDIDWRELRPTDLEAVKWLCKECFPVEYPDTWYQDITSSNQYFTQTALHNGVVIGMIVAEVKARVRCNQEDAGILDSRYPLHSKVAYILSLGVSSNYRQRGIASILLQLLVDHLTNTCSSASESVQAVYLHVLSTNQTAIDFYERRGFVLHAHMQHYYTIRGRPADGCTYVLYINGGCRPMTWLDQIVLYITVVYRWCHGMLLWLRLPLCRKRYRHTSPSDNHFHCSNNNNCHFVANSGIQGDRTLHVSVPLDLELQTEKGVPLLHPHPPPSGYRGANSSHQQNSCCLPRSVLEPLGAVDSRGSSALSSSC